MSNYIFTKQTQGTLHSIRYKYIENYFFSFEQKSTSSIENTLVSNLRLISEDYFQNIFYIVNDILYILFVSLALASFNWILLIFIYFVAFISIVVPNLFNNLIKTSTYNVTIKNDQFLNVVKNWLQALDEIRRFSIKRVLKSYISKSSANLENSQVKRKKDLCITDYVQKITDTLGIIGVPFVAGLLFFNGKIPFGAIIAASYLANGIFGSLQEIVSSYVIVKSTDKVRQEILRYLEIKRPRNLKTTNIDSIEVKDLSINFMDDRKIKYPDFIVHKNEKILLDGDSGSGKSTLLKIMLGQLSPTTGQVIFKDKNGKSLETVSGLTIDYLSQNGVMFPTTIKDNITLFDDRLDKNIANVINKVNFMHDIKKFSQGLARIVNTQNNDLSGGQQQKIILARSLIHKKPIVFMDEAISAIDNKTVDKILSTLKQSDQTIIFVAHNLNKKQRSYFDREITLRKDDKNAN